MHLRIAAMAAAATLLCGHLAAATQYFHRVTTEKIYLSSLGRLEPYITLASAKVPAGTWSVSGKGTLVNFTRADYGRSSLWGATTLHDTSATLVGQADDFPPASTLAMITVIKTTVPTWIKLRCRQDQLGLYEKVYADPGAALMITRLD
jgi:hypothetical protein